jgi:hypothetical protein
MKRCPQCNRTYEDDALSFCLDDGSPLLSTSAPSSFDPSATVQYPQSRDTSPPPTIAFPSATPSLTPPPAPPGWTPMPQAQPQGRSAWPWILGIGAVLVFLGIGLVILIFAIASVTSNNSSGNNNNSNNNNANSRIANRNTNTNRNTNSENANDNANTRSNLATFTDDFSTKTWPVLSNQFVTTAYEDEEYHMRATKGFFYVMYSPERKEYNDENATVRIGLRSIDGNIPTSGYGLTVHGEMKNNHLEDYGFLIYNGDNPKYAVVLHKAGKETKVVDWTPSRVIRTGTSPNQIEVRIHDLSMEYYINGQFITSVTDDAGYRRGRVGLYSSDTGEVAFDDLEISK